MSYKFIDEHEYKKINGDAWVENLQLELENSNINIVFGCNEEQDFKNAVLELVEELTTDNEIIIFEECLEKGGGGLGPSIPSVMEFFLRGAVFTFSMIATGFFTKMGSDGYDKLSEKFTLIHQKIKSNNSLCIEFTKSTGQNVEYYYPKNLTYSEAISAFKGMKSHLDLISPDETFLKYYYVAKTGDWQKL